MDTPIPFLSIKDNAEHFFKKMLEGDIFEYQMENFLYSDVEDLAEHHGVEIKYCPPGTSQYKEYGCFVCEVVKSLTSDKEEAKVLLKFDPNELMI